MDGSEQLNDLPVHSTPNHHPPKMDFLTKTWLQIILAAEWLVQHSSTYLKTAATTLALLFCIL